MRASRIWIVATVIAVTLGGPAVVLAEPVWQRMSLFRRIEADPDQEYVLTEDQGPWLILAVTFLGDDAPQQAHDLAIELRRRYKMPAYTHVMNFDFSKPVNGRLADGFGRPAQMRYRRDEEYQEVAVLVGDFPTIDDPLAQKTLERIKTAQPAALDAKSRPSARPLGIYRELQRQVGAAIDAYKDRDDGSNNQRGPMSHAFLTTNPLLPRDYYVPPGLDPLVIEMNRNVEHSLLDCPGKYSVQIATFKANSVIDPRQIREIESGTRQLDSQLAEAAQKAHDLTEMLIAKGYQAYEFHDRYMSIVTVGSFDSLGSRRPDGKIELIPQIHRIMETFGPQSASGVAAVGNSGVRPQMIGGIQLDAQPLPVEVPRHSVSAEFARRPNLLRR